MTHALQHTGTERLAQIARARQALLQGQASAPAQYVQPCITQSWQRCLDAGHKPDEHLSFDTISLTAQRRSVEANRALRIAARSTLEQLSVAIAQTRYFAILTNAQGEVVDTSGAIDRSDRRADLITRIGVDLSESAVGTTAIGVTLQEQRSTWLHQGEHFYHDTQWYSCAGAPIVGPDGRCAGMVDVTGIDVLERPALMHLVSSSARAIENALVLAKPHHIVLHLQWPGHANNPDGQGLVCVTPEGQLSAMNPVARHMLDLGPLQTPALHLDDIFAVSAGHLFDAQHSAQWHTVPLWSGLHLQVCCHSAGAPPYPTHHTESPMLGQALKDHETALIKSTVTQLRGNVAAAAKQLGISRSTIYRKLGK
jgi:sigma-54 dependent transcriptional regulator, acetoin dehydrogenase operon transcriptional activator AcoR